MTGAVEDRVREVKALYRGIIEQTKYPEQNGWILEQFIIIFELQMKENKKLNPRKKKRLEKKLKEIKKLFKE